MFGFTEEELRGEYLDQYIVPEDKQEESAWVDRKVLSGEPVPFDTRRRSREGTLIDIKLKSFPVVRDQKEVEISFTRKEKKGTANSWI